VPSEGTVRAASGVLVRVVVRTHRESVVVGAHHGHVRLGVDVDDFAVVVTLPVDLDRFGDEAITTDFHAGVEALAVAASLPTLRTPRGVSNSPVLARRLLEGTVFGADDGDLGVTVDVVPSNVGVVVAAVVQLRRERDELGCSFFAGGGAVVQGVLQELVSWPLCRAAPIGSRIFPVGRVVSALPVQLPSVEGTLLGEVLT
jgi:hypothetical protein